MRDGQRATFFVLGMFEASHTVVTVARASLIRPAMLLLASRRALGPCAAAFVLCLASHEAAAQNPFTPPDVTLPRTPGTGVDPSTLVPENRTPQEVMPALRDLFAPLPGDFKRMFTTPGNAVIAGVGALGTSVSRSWDDDASSSSWGNPAAFKDGQHAGAFLYHAGGAVATYTLGRITHSPRVARVGAEIFRAQIVSQTTAQVLKASVGRTRPDASNNHSFPSGHSASAFATASVVQREFGWKAGIPAYAAATWVASSRVQARRHYVSDVVAGATLGILAGRSVTVGAGNVRFSVDPMPVPGGMGVSFTKVTGK